MSVGAIIAIISFCTMVTGLFLANMFWMLMIVEVDRRREGDRVDSFFRYTRWGSRGTFREYRNSCPNGHLHKYFLAAGAMAMIGFIGLVAYMIAAYEPLVLRITSPDHGATFTAAVDTIHQRKLELR